MCVRQYAEQLAIERLSAKHGVRAARETIEAMRQGDLFPGDVGLVIAARDGGPELMTAAWGLQPSWAKDRRTGVPDPHFGRRNADNAKAETLLEKPTFRTAFRKRRCVVPASALDERAGVDGRTHWLRLAPRDGEPFGIAGLWEPENALAELPTYTMVTTSPNETIAAFHDRMPVVLDPEDTAAWLDPDRPAEDLRGLLVPCPPGWFTVEDAGPVGRAKREEPEASSLFGDD